MGSIIREDTEGEPSPALTETGKGGLLSQGYLRDAPAREYVGAGETPVFVLTDADVGVERSAEGEPTRIEPGKGYRAITVVTDRRLIVLVGNADAGGDKRVTLPLVEVAAVDTTDEALVLEMGSGVTWRCHVDASGLAEVAAYVAAAADAWNDVEGRLDAVKRSLVEATGHRDEGAYDAAIDVLRDARDDVEAVQERARSFTEDWPSEAMVDRVEGVRDRCLRTAADIRVGYARVTIDEGEEHWRNGEYDLAREAFEDALSVFEAVESLAPRHREGIDDVDRAIDRLRRSMDRLDDAPLREAIDADRRAAETDPGLEALAALAEARDRYAAVLELDPEDGERSFAGNRDRIREQREDVTDRFVETALDVGTDALDAGQWYCETGQTAYAEEELERAVEALDRGVAVAETERPARLEELRGQRSSARAELADLRDEDGPRTRADDGAAEGDEILSSQVDDSAESSRTDGDRVENSVAARSGNADEGGEATAADGGVTPVTAVLGDGVGALGPADGDVPTVDDLGTANEAEAALRDLSPARFERLAVAVLEAMELEPEPTASAACDYLAERAGTGRTNAVCVLPNGDDEAVDAATIEECVSLASSVPTADDVMIVTPRTLTDGAVRAAADRRVRLFDAAYLASVLGGGDPRAHHAPGAD